MARRVFDTSIKRVYEEVAEELKKICGKEWVSGDDAVLIAYSRDQSLEIAKFPNLVVLPETTEEVSAICKTAYSYSVPVTPWSTGANVGGGCIPQRGGIICDLRRMDKIVDFDEENMSVTIQPGVTFGRVFVEAEKRGLRNICPSAPASVSMLSNYLDKGVFQISNRYGVGTDSILGLEIVLPDGSIVRTGSLFDEKYGSICAEGPGPDISGIFQGSMGAFGICTQMVARLYPLYPYEDMVVVKFDEDDLEGVKEFLRRIARENCTLDTLLFQDAYLGMGLGANQDAAEILSIQVPRQNAIIFYGGQTEEELKIRRDQIDKVIKETGAQLAPEGMLELMKELLPWRRVFKIIQLTPRVQRMTGSFELFWFNISMDQAPGIARAFQRLVRKYFAPADPEKSDRPFPPEEVTFYLQPLEYGRTGMLEMDAYPNQGEPEGVKKGLALAREAIEMICAEGGFFDRPYGGEGSGFGWIQTPLLGTYYEVLKSLKKKIDQKNIMNPGRMGIPSEPFE